MKKAKPYKNMEECSENKVSEPAVGYQTMASMQLEADKAKLIRAIVNIDSKSLFDKVKQQLSGILNIRDNETTVELEPDSKEYIMNGLKEAFMELKEIRAGKGKSRPAEELLKELMEDGDEEDD